MFETDVIFNDVKSLITTEVTVDEPKRGNMDYLFWIICDDNSIPRLKRFLSVYPGCVFSEPFTNEELLKQIRSSEREQWMKFIGVDFKYMSMRNLIHFREIVLDIIGHGKSNFIIKWWADYDDKYKMRAGGNLKDFLCFILKLTKTQAERQMADIRYEVVSMLSDKMFDKVLSLEHLDNFVDISKFTRDFQFRTFKDTGFWFNVYTDDVLSTTKNYAELKYEMMTVYRCGYKKLYDKRYKFFMILKKDHHGPSRVILTKTYEHIRDFLGSTSFILKNRINIDIIEDAAFERLFEFGKYARK